MEWINEDDRYIGKYKTYLYNYGTYKAIPTIQINQNESIRKPCTLLHI